jgi:hypothetical protein
MQKKRKIAKDLIRILEEKLFFSIDFIEKSFE